MKTEKKLNILSKLLLTILISHQTKSQFLQIPKTKNTSVPVPPTITDFEVSRYMGRWYEQARTKNFFERKEAKNIIAIYTLLNDGSVRVINTSENNGLRSSVSGIAKFKGDENIADLDLNFGKGFFSRLVQRGEYKVVGTDYDNYAFVYTRVRFFFRERVFAWILTREKNFEGKDEEFQTILDEFLRVTGVLESELIFPLQEDL